MHSGDDELQREALSEALIQRLPAGVVIVASPSGKLIRANDECQAIWRERTCDPAAWKGFHADGSPYTPAEWPLARSLAAGEVVRREDIRIVRGDGTAGVIRASSAPIEGDGGRRVAAAMTFFDVTAETREHDALQFIADASAIATDGVDADEVLRQLGERAVPQFADLAFVYLLDDAGRLRRQHASAAAPAVQTIIHEMWERFPPTSIVVRPFLETARSRLHDFREAEAWSLIENREQRAILASLDIRSAISVPMRASGHALGVIAFALTGASRVYEQSDLLVADEIARRAATAIEKSQLLASERRARQEAERASRAKDEFLAVLSHELRTPMTTVIGWADFLKMTHGNDPDLAGPIDSLRASAGVQAKLVDELLDASRIVAGKLPVRKRETELVGIVRSAVQSITMAAADKGVTLYFDPPSEPLPIHADPDRLQQAVTNLLVNAIKFTPASGTIEVDVRRGDGHAEVVVQDTGEGIAAEFLPHVFDRFRQASMSDSRRYSGLGLGLSIVQHIVQVHDGTVRAESEGIGRGARFTIRLPLA